MGGTTTLTPLRNLTFINLKDYCKIDGVSDDSTNFTNAYQAASTLGMGLFHPGGTLVKGNDTLLANVPIVGAGSGVSIFKLKNGANTDLFSGQTGSINVGAASGTGSAGTLFNFGISDVTLDGNKANQTSGTSYPLRFYGYGGIFRNLRIKNGYTGGVLSDWNGGAASPGNDSMESQWENIKIHDCNGIGLQVGGPHDSQFKNVIIYNTGSHAIHIAPNASALQFANCHVWNIPQGVNAVGWLIETGYCQFTNCESERTDGMSVALIAPECRWDGHIFGASGGLTTNGMQLGQAAGQTPYPSMVQQSAGVTTAVIASGNIVTGIFDYCELSHGAIWFANSGGSNVITATIFQQNGTAITGTINTLDTYLIHVNGLTPDGSVGKSGGFQMASSAFNGFLMYDQSGHQALSMNANNAIFNIGNSGSLKGYSDAFLSTQQFKLDASNGDITTNGWVASGQSATAPVLATSGTIATANIGVSRVAPAGAVTGVILAAGTQAGQMVTVVNESAAANTITFNTTASTSNVADAATEAAIPGLTARTYIWDSSTSRWYRCN